MSQPMPLTAAANEDEGQSWAAVLILTLVPFFAIFLTLFYARTLGPQVVIALLIPILVGFGSVWAVFSYRESRREASRATEVVNFPSRRVASAALGKSGVGAGYLLASLASGLVPEVLAFWWWDEFVRTGILGGTAVWLTVFFAMLGAPFFIITIWLWLRPPADFFGDSH
jgi:hypothetical protein